VLIAASLPNHPLLVHIPVVLVPLAALGAIAIAVRPKWMTHYGFLLLGTTAVGFVGAVLAAGTGEDLLEQFTNAGQTISPTLQHHVDMGDTARGVSGLFFLMVLLWVGFAWWRRRAGEEQAAAKVRRPKVLAAVLMVLAIGAGVAATTVITIAGHNGAKSVWEQKTR
jgi:uncharacterized membrane protein